MGACKVGKLKDNFIINPNSEQLLESELDLVVAGTKDGVLMVESEAKELSEDEMLEAVVFGQTSYKEVLNLIIELAEEAAKDPWELIKVDTSNEDSLVSDKYKEKILSAYTIKNKKDRQEKLKEVSQSLEELSQESEIDIKKLSSSLGKLQKKIVREKILDFKNKNRWKKNR